MQFSRMSGESGEGRRQVSDASKQLIKLTGRGY